jgi:hypothetical protein
MTDLTKEAAIDLLMKRLGDRLKAMPAAVWATAGHALGAVPAATGLVTGSCCYMVDGAKVCVDNMTKAECDSLGGTWLAVTCAQRTDCH